MKIVCDKCQTKYSIADEKVSGKVFKIRCKKCSHIILVRGTEVAAAAPQGGEATLVDAAPPVGEDDKVWFLVVAGEQVGPYAMAEVRGRQSTGEVDGDTYAWREGFGDWLRLAHIEEFRDLFAANGAGAGSAESLSPTSGMFAQQQQTESPAEQAGAAGQQVQSEPSPLPQQGAAGTADLFSRVDSSASPVPVAARPAAAPSDDPFSPLPSAVPGASDGGAGAFEQGEAARPRAAAAMSGGAGPMGDSRLTGQRNENSVLFSLSNLSAMASAGSSVKQSSESRPGYATARSEGSGLIDIRAMAAATLSSAGSSNPSDSVMDIPSFSTAPVFTPVVSAPVMMPTPESGMPKWAWALIAVVLLAVFGIGGLVMTLVLRKPEAALASNPGGGFAPVAGQPATGSTPAPAPVGGAVNANPAGAAQAAAAATEKEKAGEAGKAAAEAASRKGGKHVDAKAAEAARKGGKGGAPAPAAAVAAAQPAPPPPAADKPAKKKPASDSLDDLLNSVPDSNVGKRAAAAPRPAPVAAAPADDPNLSDQLGRGDVMGGMKAVEPRVLNCYAQYHVPGQAVVSLSIAKTGRVTSASVGGALAGTPTGDCVAKAVRSASFKRFNGATMSIQYPFTLR